MHRPKCNIFESKRVFYRWRQPFNKATKTQQSKLQTQCIKWIVVNIDIKFKRLPMQCHFSFILSFQISISYIWSHFHCIYTPFTFFFFLFFTLFRLPFVTTTGGGGGVLFLYLITICFTYISCNSYTYVIVGGWWT